MIYKVNTIRESEYTVYDYITQLESYIEMIDNGIITESDSIGIIERLVDNIKILFAKDKTEVLDKYKNYVNQMDDCKDRLTALKNKYEKSKINIVYPYEYYEVTVYAGSTAVTTRYSRDAKFITDIPDPQTVVNMIGKDSYTQKAKLNSMMHKYSKDTRYASFGVGKDTRKGTVFDCGKAAYDKIQNLKKDIDTFLPICKKSIDAILKAEKDIKAAKNNGEKVPLKIKMMLNIIKNIYHHNAGYVFALETATEKQIKTLNKYIKKIEKEK